MIRSAQPRQPLRVSVCIPTCARPTLIVRSVGSILAQTVLPLEILIGDDSDDDATAEAVRRLQAETDIPLRLFRNQPRLGQGRNVGNLIAHVEGDAILLLHDDDTVEPRGIEILSRALEEDDVIVAFGRSSIVDPQGRRDPAATASLNAYYYRTARYAGPICDTLACAAVQQIPGSGYMVRTSAARTSSYDEAARHHNACDYVFNVELARRAAGSFYFCDESVHSYHRTEESLSRSPTGNSAVMAFAYAHSLAVDLDDPRYLKWMRERSTVAIGQAARLGLVDQGWCWFFGPHHRRRIASLLGVKSALKLLWAQACGRRHDESVLPLPISSTPPLPDDRASSSRRSRFVDEFAAR